MDVVSMTFGRLPVSARTDPVTQAVQEMFPELNGYAVQLCGGNQDDADDLVQLALVKVVQAGPESRAKRALLERDMAYLKTAVRNARIDLYRKKERDRSGVQRLGLRTEPHLLVAQMALDPSRKAVVESEEVELAQLIDSLGLPERQREVLEIVQLHGLKPAEVGQILGLSPRTVSNYLSIIRAKLLRRLALEGEFDPNRADE